MEIMVKGETPPLTTLLYYKENDKSNKKIKKFLTFLEKSVDLYDHIWYTISSVVS